MGITFDDVREYELLSDNMLRLLPSKCRCGQNLVLSDSLRNLKCSDASCRYITVDRINKVNKQLNLGISTVDIDRLSKKLNLITPYQLLMLDSAYNSNIVNTTDIHNIDDVVTNIKKLKSKHWYIYEIVEICGIDCVSTVAKKLFDGFLSVTEAYDEIEQGQVAYINDRLGIKSSDGAILTIGIYDKILELKEELIFCETLLKLNNYSRKILRISFCDNNLPFVNKTETIKYLESISNYKFVLVSTINNNTDILIRNSDIKNPKFRAAKIINDKYVASEMNSGKISLSDIHKIRANELKPVGDKIYVDTLENVIDRLIKFTGGV